MTGKKGYFITTALLLFTLTSVNAEDSWPSKEQIDLVAARKADFPGARFVTEIDWYEPLEVVRGGGNTALAAELEQSPATDAADEYVAGQNSFALIFWKDGAIRHEKYWPGFNAASRFDTASMHKTVVGVLLGIASDEGLVKSVNDPLSDYLPELEGTPRGSAPLRSFLEMASGMRSPGYSDDPASPYWQAYLGNDLPQAIAHWPDTGEPDQEFYYANANTQYLAWVIERTSGQRYADFLSTRLWQPIGAGDARVWLDHEGGSPRAWCCLHASARDWLKFGLLFLNHGKAGDRQVVSAEWLERMTAASSLNPNYGWQIWRGSPHNPGRIYGRGIPVVIPAKAPFAREDVVFLDGSGGQRVYVIPSENAVIVRIGAPAPEWDDSELPNLLLAGGKGEN